MNLIERNKVIEKLNILRKLCPDLRTSKMKRDLLHDIEQLPIIEAEPVVYGKWKWDENAIDWGIGAWVCSKCHSTNENIHARKDENPLFWKGSQRCPVCGAKMDGGSE